MSAITISKSPKRCQHICIRTKGWIHQRYGANRAGRAVRLLCRRPKAASAFKSIHKSHVARVVLHLACRDLVALHLHENGGPWLGCAMNALALPATGRIKPTEVVGVCLFLYFGLSKGSVSWLLLAAILYSCLWPSSVSLVWQVLLNDSDPLWVRLRHLHIADLTELLHTEYLASRVIRIHVFCFENIICRRYKKFIVDNKDAADLSKKGLNMKAMASGMKSLPKFQVPSLPSPLAGHLSERCSRCRSRKRQPGTRCIYTLLRS